MIASLGDIVFEVSDDQVRTFKGLKYNVGAKYSTHNRIGNRPLLEYTGVETETLTMNVKLSAYHGLDPRKEMYKINEACRNGEILRFVLGRTQFGRYRWVITKVSNSITRVDNKGTVLSIEMSLTLNSYFKR